MWSNLSRFIIRNRILLLILLGLWTAFMGYKAKDVKLSYDFPQVIPTTDPDYVEYQNFKEKFGAGGNILVIGFNDRDIFDLKVFNDWRILADEIDSLEGITHVTTIGDLYNLKKNPVRKAFTITPIVKAPPTSQGELDSIKKVILSLPIYEKLFYNRKTGATFMAVEIEKEALNSEKRSKILRDILNRTEKFSEVWSIDLKFSGLPYIRSRITQKVQKELIFFSILAIVITSLFLLLFFRSLYAVVFPLAVILVVIVTSVGSIVLLGYQITILLSLIPPLIAIIGVPNFIYFLNKYHQEYHKHGNKMLAITRMVQKIGIVTFLTNITTAIGFGVLAFTDSPVLKEFGVVASINVAATFVVSVIMIPVTFSFLPPPSSRQTKYLNSKFMDFLIRYITKWVLLYRGRIYLFSILIVVLSVIGLVKLKAVGFILDDVPHRDRLYTDLQFFEENFNGIMPFEMVLTIKDPKGIQELGTLEKISEFQDSLSHYEEFSRSISMADFVKFSRQAFYNGNEKMYGLPNGREVNFLLPYLKNFEVPESTGLSSTLVDTSGQIARITTNTADIGSVRLRSLVSKLEKTTERIFVDGNIQVEFTGISLIFLKNNKYLIESLVYSLILAFILVSIIMGFLFGRIRMIILSLVPNFIPLMVTAGLMGYFGVPLKPSTVLIFSIAFGISVDDAIHFLAKYRQELKYHDWDIRKTVTVALKETGVSMIYTSIVLFFGFGMFSPSSFGGTSSLGILTSTTLLVAMLTNVVLLPSLILTFDRKKKSRKKSTI